MPKRNPFGRRKTDWIIPVILFSLCLVAVAWAVYNRVQASNTERINQTYREQATARERQLKELEKQSKVK